MKYLNVLKEYNKQLDGIYKKLLKESCCDEGKTCDCGKEDCPICGKKVDEDDMLKGGLHNGHKKVDEEEDLNKKQMTEFDEGEDPEGKTAKKMLTADEFLKQNEEELPKAEEPKEEPKEEEPKEEPKEEPEKKVDEAKGGKTIRELMGKADEVSEGTDFENEVKRFFGLNEDDPLKGGHHNGHKEVDEGVEDNYKMDASDIFTEGEKEDKPKEEPKDESKEEPKDEPKEEPKDEPEKKVDEAKGGKTIRELMGKVDELDEAEGKKKAEKEHAEELKDEPTEEPKEEPKDEPKDEPKEEPKDEEPTDDEDDEEKSLNESIQAITKFVKANKRFFG